MSGNFAGSGLDPQAEDMIEAYAWADVAYCRRLPGAHDLKKQAQERLKPEQIRAAWALAREYKQNYIPKTEGIV